MKQIRKKDYKSWESYYWDYQSTLSEEYYLPYIIKYGKSLSRKASKVIDIGCGNGGFIANIGKNINQTVKGIDIKEFNTWNNQYADYKVHNILNDDNKKYIGKYDLVILRDVIEHIDKKYKINFIKKAASFMSNDGEMLVTFPPYLSPFGLHQQALMKSFLRIIPFLSILPKKILKILVMKFETEDIWNKTEEIIDSSMTIRGFKKLLKYSNLIIAKKRYFSIRPSHEIRYGVKSFRSPLGVFPIIREFFILGTCYIIKHNNQK